VQFTTPEVLPEALVTNSVGVAPTNGSGGGGGGGSGSGGGGSSSG
jgi:hypothetical protein